MNWPQIKALIQDKDKASLSLIFHDHDFLESDENLQINAAGLLLKQKRYPECEELIQIIESKFKGAAPTIFLFLKADLYLDTERFYEAITCYDKILNLQGDDIAFNNRAFAYLSLKRYKEAVDDFRHSLELNPKNVVSLRSIADAHIKLSQPSEAIPYLLKAIEIEPQNSDAHTNLGIAYYKTEQWVDAYESLQKAVKLDPKNELAARGIRKIEKNFDLEKK